MVLLDVWNVARFAQIANEEFEAGVLSDISPMARIPPRRGLSRHSWKPHDVTCRSRRVNSSPKEALLAFAPGVRGTCLYQLMEAPHYGILCNYWYAHEINRCDVLPFWEAESWRGKSRLDPQFLA